MASFTRTDTSLVSRWWWEIDRWNYVALLTLVVIGAILVLASSPAVANRIGLDQYYFVNRQYVFLILGAIVMTGVSFMSLKGVRRLAVIATGAAIMMMILTLIVGAEVNGATRWIYIGGMSLQPSEFVKPAFCVAAAWMFSLQRLGGTVPGYAVSTSCYVLIAGLLLLQPDVGMTIVISAVWGVQFFLAGMPLLLVTLLALLFIAGSVLAYFIFDHVKLRVDRFFNPESGDNFQVDRALDAFREGGLVGVGPGEGRVLVPDAHTDFVLAVAGEEFGLIACLIIVCLFAFIVLRGFSRVMRDNDLFVLLATAGLLVQFAMQAIINMASTINLMPPKGITLPFISYGGSSTIGLAFGMGMMLALTRHRRSGGRA